MYQIEATCVLWGIDKGHQALLKMVFLSLATPNYKLDILLLLTKKNLYNSPSPYTYVLPANNWFMRKHFNLKPSLLFGVGDFI